MEIEDGRGGSIFEVSGVVEAVMIEVKSIVMIIAVITSALVR
jgi:hypothetical protein